MSNDNIVDMNEKKPVNSRFYVKTGLGFILLVLVFALFLASVIIVKEGEYKVVRQFGEVVKIEDEPGLKFKIPFIQSVTTLPNKKLVYDVDQKEINTLDKKRMIIDNFAIWHIVGPEDMIENARTVENAEARMGEFIFSAIRSELGQMNYEEIINDEKSSRGNLNETVKDRVNELLARDNYGIQVDDVRIKRTDLPDENEQSVYLRMISERESKAQEYLSQGDAEKNRITATTDRKVKEMISTTNAEAAQIRGEGEKEAARIYNEAFEKDGEFYSLYRTLQSYKQTINGETTIFIPQDSPYAQLLLGYFN
ncbi:protease modulator HflC [Bacillaceae bacterium S4-13-58]